MKSEFERLVEEYRSDWRSDAACIGMDWRMFFPERGKTPREAKQICAQCPVVEQCGEYAVTSRQGFGIWGGLTETERKGIRRRRHLKLFQESA